MPLVVGLGPGAPDAVPAAALAALAAAPRVLAPPLEPALLAALAPVVPAPLGDLAGVPEGAAVAAPDPEAHRIALALPGARTLPAREALRDRAIGAEVARLARVGARLRRDCPWDREQDAASIVPHTVEEAYEVADAVAEGDDAKQADEIGDLLFQSVFLSQLLEEAGTTDLAGVAGQQADKLVSRHPHVYGDAVARDAERVLDLWERNKRAERAGQGIFHDIPASLPALGLASKTQGRAAAVGFVFGGVEEALEALREEVGELGREPNAHELGDVLFAAVSVGRQIGEDPELALRAAARRFRSRVERAAALARDAGVRFEDLDAHGQLAWYARAAAGA
jgi:MazG family protein